MLLNKRTFEFNSTAFLFFFSYFLFSRILFLPPLSRGTLEQEQGRSEAITLLAPHPLRAGPKMRPGVSVNFVTSSANDGVFEKEIRAKNNICAVEGGGRTTVIATDLLYYPVLLNLVYSTYLECMYAPDTTSVLDPEMMIANPF